VEKHGKGMELPFTQNKKPIELVNVKVVDGDGKESVD
jgi:hypothetical protein